MASTHKSLRSGTANKRPTTSIADGQIALNTNTTSPGLFFKDSTGATIIKVGPVHVGTTAPNASPAAGGSSGNSTGEVWLDTSLTPNGVKIWNGASWTNATPIGSTTVQGLLELATNAETQTGTDPDRAVTPAGLQSKVSDSTSTTSSTTIASSTAVKSAYDLANAALPKSGGTVTGNLEIGTTGSLSFEGATADAFETTIAVVDPTADRTITLPDTTGTVVTTGDTGTVTSTMIADGTIVDADISASAEIAVSKLADGAARQLLQTDAAGTGVEWASNIDIPGTLDVTSAATFDSSVAVTGALTKSGNNVVTVGDSGTVTSTMIADGTIVNGDINASAAIAGTKISPDFGSQTIATTGIVSHALGTAAAPTVTFTGDTNTGIYSPGADQVAISTAGSGRLFVNSSGDIGMGTNALINSAGYTSLFLNGSLGGSIGFKTGDVIKQYIYSTATTLNYYGGGSDSHIFYCNTEKMRLTPTGLGVGTSSPSDVLHVEGTIRTSSGSSNAQFANNYLRSNQAGTFYFDQNSGSQDFAFRVSNVTNLDTTAMTIKSSGRVGIGTSNVNAPLEVNKAASGLTEIVRLGGTASATNDGWKLSFYQSTVGEKGYIGSFYDGSAWQTVTNGDIQTIRTGGTERVRVDSSGRVGIGTSTFSVGTSNELAVNGSSSSSVSLKRGDALAGYVGCTSSAMLVNSVSNLPLLFYTNDTERARIDSSGRWLLGTSSSSNLYAIGGANFAPKVQIQGTDPIELGVQRTDGPPYVHIANGQSGLASGNDVGFISFNGKDSNNLLVQAAQISAAVDGTPGANDMPGRLVFSTTADGASSPTERMRITNAGALSYSPCSGSDLVGNEACGFVGDGTYAPIYKVKTALTSTKYAARFYNGNGEVGNITMNGSATAYNTSSDYRLKENVVAVVDGITRLQQLKPSRFNFKADPTNIVDGFIAHEVQAVVPEAVTGEKDAVDSDGNPKYQGIDQSKLVPLLTAALQEAIGEIESLKARVAALESA